MGVVMYTIMALMVLERAAVDAAMGFSLARCQYSSKFGLGLPWVLP